MKSKRLIFFLVGFLILFSLNTFAETTKLKSIGQYTFVRIRGRVPTQDVMKMLVDRYAADIKYGFDLAGAGDLYLPFMDQLKSAFFRGEIAARWRQAPLDALPLAGKGEGRPGYRVGRQGAP